MDDGEGHEYESSVSHEENLMKIRIGSPDFTVQGRQAVPDSLSRRAGHPLGREPRLGERELRRPALERDGNRVAGADRSLQGDGALCPRDLNDFELTSDAWTGSFNTREKNFTKRMVDGRDARVHDRAAAAARGDHGRDLDAVRRRRQARLGKEFAWWLADNFPYAVFPATLAFCFVSWFFRGRDLPGTGTIVVNYESPDGLTPAEVGTLIDEKVDLRDISATIIDLAVRGYLKIEEIQSSSWFSSGSDYRFNKLKGPEGLKSFETEAVQPDLRARRQGHAERPPGEVLPGAAPRSGMTSIEG